MDALSRAEWEVMKVFWDRGELLVRDVTRALEERRGWARNTVRTIIERLVDKGYLARRRVGPVDLFCPKVARTAVVGRAIDEFVENVLDGSIAPFVTRLVEKGDIDRGEIDALRKLLAQKGRKKR